MRLISMARVATAACLAGLLVSLSACTIPTADDIHTRGSSHAFLRDTREYRAVDNAIYDVLAEMYGKDRVILVETPEVEFHRWAATSNEYASGTDRQRTRIECRPWLGSDGYWAPEVTVKGEFSLQQSPFKLKAPGSFGTNPWIEGGRNTKTEAVIANKINDRIRAWRAAGSNDPGNRRDEWLDRTSAGGR